MNDTSKLDLDGGYVYSTGRSAIAVNSNGAIAITDTNVYGIVA